MSRICIPQFLGISYVHLTHEYISSLRYEKQSFTISTIDSAKLCHNKTFKKLTINENTPPPNLNDLSLAGWFLDCIDLLKEIRIKL